MNDEQIKYMVDRFLGWRLPENFRPDTGISFNPFYNVEYNAARGKPPARHEPTGTCLFDATQADAMIRYLVEGLSAGAEVERLRDAIAEIHRGFAPDGTYVGRPIYEIAPELCTSAPSA